MSDQENYTLFKLRRAKNGYIMEKRDIIDGAKTEIEELVGTDGEDEVETFKSFLWDIIDNYGPSTSRYDAKRVYVRVEPGDKTDADSEQIDWVLECLVNDKQDTEDWAAYGERIHTELTKRVKESKEFKVRNGYK